MPDSTETQLNTTVVVPEEFDDYVEVNDAGYDKETQHISVAVPSVHARPANLDPRVNGPFLDEVREVEAANARDGRYRSEAAKDRAKKRFEAGKKQAKKNQAEAEKTEAAEEVKEEKATK